MDLMSTLSPKKNVNNPIKSEKTDGVIKHVKYTIEHIEQAPKVTIPSTVKNLESGDVTQYEDVPEHKTSFKLIDIYSNCNLHILYNSQFKQLDNYNIQKKFSSEPELIQREIRIDGINKQIQYMDKVYDTLNFEFKIEFQTEMNVEQITINDKLHFKHNMIIVPLEYNYIIDNILSRIYHNFTHVAFCNTHDKQRMILPTTTFNILTINKQFCNTCEFYSICDGK